MKTITEQIMDEWMTQSPKMKHSEKEKWLRESLERVENAAKKEQMENDYYSDCSGCKDGHSSYWKTIIESPQWDAWYKEQMNRQHKMAETMNTSLEVFDVDESQEGGWLGKEHFQAFLKFTKTI